MRSVALLACLLTAKCSWAQYTPVSFQPGDEMLRAAHLIRDSGNISFIIRPLWGTTDPYQVLDSGLKIRKKWFDLKLMPISGTIKWNSKRPFGWNDGPLQMINGFQQMYTAGFFAKAGPLEIQLQPEWVQAEDKQYQTTPAFGNNQQKRFEKTYLGQSMMQLRVWKFSLGAGTRNLWWGPGQFSSLMLSNQAPGFQHLFFQTNRPIKTPIGYLEGQIIGGILTQDSTRGMENNYLKPMAITNKKRYLSGFIFTYQPVFMKGFAFGVSRTEQAYLDDIKQSDYTFFNKYLRTFKLASPIDNYNQVGLNTDGQVSFSVRWKLPKHLSELYMEYGYNDFKQNIRDLAVNPNHSSAYTLGFKKIIVTKKIHWDVSGEITQMAQTTSYILRNAGNWYVHGGIAPGLTHQNQILGAGAGYGNNVQTLQLIRRKGFEHYGIRLQRIQNDPKGLTGSFQLLGMREISWKDWAVTLLAQKRWKMLYIKGELAGVKSKNYGWEKKDVFNLMIQCQWGVWF